ncbi:hypothetical protein CL622_05340 [archaeon]|nr:hypothetical protein [archaeon]
MHRIVKEDIKNIASSISDISHELEGKTVLVVGGAGFLGKYLVLTLQKLNEQFKLPCKIVVVDNFITGLEGKINLDENTKIIKHDICKKLQFEDNINYILQAASIASPIFYDKYKLETIDVGYLGNKNMLELAKEKSVESFLFFSTSEVYGNPGPKDIPTNESYNGNVSCTGPRACYDEPKRVGETLCVCYADVHNVPVKIARPFNVFGPGMRLDDGRAAVNFIVSCLKGRDVPIYGDGGQTRAWTYISDATAGFFRILLSKKNKEAYNIGSDEREISTLNLAQMIHSIVGNEDSKIKMVASPNKTYGDKQIDPNRRFPDLKKIKTKIGYKINVTLKDGLERFKNWIEDELEDQIITEQKSCRLTGSQKLEAVVDFGMVPLANNLPLVNKSNNVKKYPLKLQFCSDSYGCQLSYTAPPKKLFDHYLYVTSTSNTLREHFEKYASNIYKYLNLSKESLVVDIGSNDGLLLKNFKKLGARVVGVEPASNICDIAIKNGVDTVNGYFNEYIVKNIITVKGKADVITVNNAFPHIADIHGLTSSINSLLKPNGVLILEVQYLLDTLKTVTFDNVYHEHLSYFSTLSLVEFFKTYNMELFKIEKVNTHGGSLRVFIKKQECNIQIDKSVDEQIKIEKEYGLDTIKPYQDFNKKINDRKINLLNLLKKLKGDNKKIVGYGAPAKATTLLNFFGVNNDFLDYIIEDNELKHGREVPGTNIPIVPKKMIDKNIPDYVLILAWNFSEEIIKNNLDFLSKGIKFIVLGKEALIYDENFIQ